MQRITKDSNKWSKSKQRPGLVSDIDLKLNHLIQEEKELKRKFEDLVKQFRSYTFFKKVHKKFKSFGKQAVDQERECGRRNCEEVVSVWSTSSESGQTLKTVSGGGKKENLNSSGGRIDKRRGDRRRNTDDSRHHSANNNLTKDFSCQTERFDKVRCISNKDTQTEYFGMCLMEKPPEVIKNYRSCIQVNSKSSWEHYVLASLEILLLKDETENCFRKLLQLYNELKLKDIKDVGKPYYGKTSKKKVSFQKKLSLLALKEKGGMDSEIGMRRKYDSSREMNETKVSKERKASNDRDLKTPIICWNDQAKKCQIVEEIKPMGILKKMRENKENGETKIKNKKVTEFENDRLRESLAVGRLKNMVRSRREEFLCDHSYKTKTSQPKYLQANEVFQSICENLSEKISGNLINAIKRLGCGGLMEDGWEEAREKRGRHGAKRKRRRIKSPKRGNLCKRSPTRKRKEGSRRRLPRSEGHLNRKIEIIEEWTTSDEIDSKEEKNHKGIAKTKFNKPELNSVDRLKTGNKDVIWEINSEIQVPFLSSIQNDWNREAQNVSFHSEGNTNSGDNSEDESMWQEMGHPPTIGKDGDYPIRGLPTDHPWLTFVPRSKGKDKGWLREANQWTTTTINSCSAIGDIGPLDWTMPAPPSAESIAVAASDAREPWDNPNGDSHCQQDGFRSIESSEIELRYEQSSMALCPRTDRECKLSRANSNSNESIANNLLSCLSFDSPGELSLELIPIVEKKLAFNSSQWPSSKCSSGRSSMTTPFPMSRTSSETSFYSLMSAHCYSASSSRTLVRISSSVSLANIPIHSFILETSATD